MGNKLLSFVRWYKINNKLRIKKSMTSARKIKYEDHALGFKFF